MEKGASSHHLDFFSFLEFYNQVLDINRPNKPSRLFSCYPLQSTSTFLGAVLPYVQETLAIRPLERPSLIPLTELASQNARVTKIMNHFAHMRTTFLDLSATTPWQWLKMRYHLTQVTKNYYQHHVSNTSPFYELLNYNLLIPRAHDTQEVTAFCEHIKEGVQHLTTKLYISQEDLKPNAQHPDTCRNLIKVLLSELPHLQDFQESKTSQAFNVTMNFLRLYLSLTGNYFDQNHQIRENKFGKLHSFLVKIIGDDLTQEHLLMIWEKPKGQENIKKLLTSIQNPFNPKIRELNAFNYYADQIVEMIGEPHQERQGQEVPPDQDDSLATAVRNDLNEIYQAASGFLTQLLTW